MQTDLKLNENYRFLSISQLSYSLKDDLIQTNGETYQFGCERLAVNNVKLHRQPPIVPWYPVILQNKRQSNRLPPRCRAETGDVEPIRMAAARRTINFENAGSLIDIWNKISEWTIQVKSQRDAAVLTAIENASSDSPCLYSKHAGEAD